MNEKLIREALESVVDRFAMRWSDGKLAGGAFDCGVMKKVYEALASLDAEKGEYCEYSLDENKAPWPRVSYRSACNFQLCVTEGYTTDEYCNPSNEIKPLKGTCMKCGKPIRIKKPS